MIRKEIEYESTKYVLRSKIDFAEDENILWVNKPKDTSRITLFEGLGIYDTISVAMGVQGFSLLWIVSILINERLKGMHLTLLIFFCFLIIFIDLIKRWMRRKTVYVLTDKRLIIDKANLEFYNYFSMDISDIDTMKLTEYKDGYGYIEFKPKGNRSFLNLDLIALRINSDIRFELIKNAKEEYKNIKTKITNLNVE